MFTNKSHYILLYLCHPHNVRHGLISFSSLNYTSVELQEVECAHYSVTQTGHSEFFRWPEDPRPEVLLSRIFFFFLTPSFLCLFCPLEKFRIKIFTSEYHHSHLFVFCMGVFGTQRHIRDIF